MAAAKAAGREDALRSDLATWTHPAQLQSNGAAPTAAAAATKTTSSISVRGSSAAQREKRAAVQKKAY
eukprot:COSAG01_NODE_4968_length_4584_cov_4.769008_2_plen_68_part_00